MGYKHMKELVCFAGGVLFGTAGIKVLASKDAKKVYVQTAAAALRARLRDGHCKQGAGERRGCAGRG